jgi:hypothetical protein
MVGRFNISLGITYSDMNPKGLGTSPLACGAFGISDELRRLGLRNSNDLHCRR